VPVMTFSRLFPVRSRRCRRRAHVIEQETLVLAAGAILRARVGARSEKRDRSRLAGHGDVIGAQSIVVVLEGGRGADVMAVEVDVDHVVVRPSR